MTEARSRRVYFALWPDDEATVDHRSGADLVPHVTRARRARCASLPRLGTPIGWQVSEFTLVESHLHPSAASYSMLSRFPLAEADAV